MISRYLHIQYFQHHIDLGVPSWSPALLLQEEMGERQMDLEMETCLSFLPNHHGPFQGIREAPFWNVFARLTEGGRGGHSLWVDYILPKASLLVNQSPAMLGLNVRMAACEGIWESLLQLCLQLFIIFSRSDTVPSILQVRKQSKGLIEIKNRFQLNATQDCCHFDIFAHGVYGCNWGLDPVHDEPGKGTKQKSQVLQRTQL